MKHVFSGYFAGLITGGTFFLKLTYPTSKLVEKDEIVRQVAWIVGIVHSVAILATAVFSL